MARGKLASQSPQVPQELWNPINDLYVYLNQLDREIPFWKDLSVEETLASNITLAASPFFQVPLRINGVLRFRFTLFVLANFDFRLTGPAGPANVHIKQAIAINAAVTHAHFTAYHAADQTITVANGPGTVVLEGLVINGATAGTFALQWAQNTSSATLSRILKGSSFQYSYLPL